MDNQSHTSQDSGATKRNANYLLHRKDGMDNFIPWKRLFTSQLPTSSNKDIQYLGPSLMEESENSDGGFKAKMAEVKEYPEMRIILAQEYRRRTIDLTVLWNMLVERLSDDIKELLLASPEFAERRLVEEKRISATLLRILKEIVSGGITTDPHHQMLRNLKSLHQVTQKRGETIRL
jgi:hypothetical protein